VTTTAAAHADMTDAQMIALCAHAMGLPPLEARQAYERDVGARFERYDPLNNDAQAMALVKRFAIAATQTVGGWLVDANEGACVESATNENLNRAIVECVAKIALASRQGKPQENVEAE
jgi:hypothetical protein